MIADLSPTGQGLIGDQSPTQISLRPIGDQSPTSRRPIADLSATDRGLVSMQRAFQHDIQHPGRLAICIKRFRGPVADWSPIGFT